MAERGVDPLLAICGAILFAGALFSYMLIRRSGLFDSDRIAVRSLAVVFLIVTGGFVATTFVGAAVGAFINPVVGEITWAAGLIVSVVAATSVLYRASSGESIRDGLRRGLSKRQQAR